MKTLNKLSMWLVVFCLLVSGCNSQEGTSTGNPMRAQMSVQGTEPNSLSASEKMQSVDSLSAPVSIDLTDSAGNTVGQLNLTDARMAVINFEFERDSDGVEDDSVEYRDVYILDLLNDTATPSFPEVLVVGGTYFDLVFETTVVTDSDVDRNGDSLIEASDPLNGHSFYLEGTYTGPSATGAQTDIPIKIALNSEGEIELTGSNDTSVGFTITEGAVNQIIVAFRLAKWFRFDNSETNWSTLEPSQFIVSGGEINIDPTTSSVNQELASVIENNIAFSADYGKDLDGDGELSAEEDDDPDDEDDLDD